jgi:hypothetical protein
MTPTTTALHIATLTSSVYKRTINPRKEELADNYSSELPRILPPDKQRT